jgi:hypothetical protein
MEFKFYIIINTQNMKLIDFKRYEIFDYNTQHMVLVELLFAHDITISA